MLSISYYSDRWASHTLCAGGITRCEMEGGTVVTCQLHYVHVDEVEHHKKKSAGLRWLHIRMWECLFNYSHCQKGERGVSHCKFVCPVIILVQKDFRCLFMFMFLPYLGESVYVLFNPHPIYYLDTAPQASVSGVGLWSDSEHSCRQQMICSRVHCSSGKASWSRVNWPCLVRISSFTWAQDDRATAQRQARYSTGLTCDWWVMYGGFEVTLQYFSSHLAQGTGLWSVYTTARWHHRIFKAASSFFIHVEIHEI